MWTNEKNNSEYRTQKRANKNKKKIEKSKENTNYISNCFDHKKGINTSTHNREIKKNKIKTRN